MKKILESFYDIFPKDIPRGWPPIKGIEHQTNFMMGATLPSKAAYKANLEESKEIDQNNDEEEEEEYLDGRNSENERRKEDNQDVPITWLILRWQFLYSKEKNDLELYLE
ncbi:hypothetical protein CR513_10810, partial [Mucuna pruriens]